MPTGYPGQAGNPVGYAAAPGFPGLTPFTGTLVSGTVGAHQVYSFFDFNAGSSGTNVSGLSYVDFVGCRFQSNSQNNYNVQVTGSDHITFTYCSFVPLVSFATSPPGAAWPSAGSYPNTPSPLTFTTGVNCLDGTHGFQYGCNVPDGGPVTWSFCDFWGHGQNGPGFFTTTAQMICDNCWIHDPCNQAPNGYHTDAVGYQNAAVGPSNVTISNCTIAGLGNTNALAFQAATGGYSNIQITGNYVTGYGNMIALGVVGGTLFTNSTFSNNVIGTDIQWWEFILYDDYTATFNSPNNSWRNNTLHVVPGSINWPGGTPYNQGFTSGQSAPVFSNANNGQFLWPDNTLHATDFTGGGGGGGTASGSGAFRGVAAFTSSAKIPSITATTRMAAVGAFTTAAKIPSVNETANMAGVGQLTISAAGIGGFPGQAGNPVGYAAAPGYPGSLTPFTGTLVSGTSGAHQIYSFFDFNNGTFPNVTLGSGLQYIDFIGCRFQSNANTPHPAAESSSNVYLNGAKNITFSYCSWTPLASNYTINPNYGSGTAAWPASGAGHNVVVQVGGLDTDPTANAIIETDAYTYGLLIQNNTSGPVTVSHCEFWGFGNAAIDWNTNTTAQFTIDNCWIHDNAAWGPTNDEHLDALGYLLAGPPPSNITISNCTLACLGSNGGGDNLAWQGGSANFNNINHIHNYISGYGYTIILAGGDLGGIFTNSQFVNNVIGTDVQSYWGFLYQDPTIRDYSPMFSANGNLWRGNTINVVPGTTYASTVDTRAQFTNADNGKFFLPNGTYSATDFTGGGTSANATASMQATGAFSATGKIPSLTVSAALRGVGTLSAGLGSRFFSSAAMAGASAFTSRVVGPPADMFVIGIINSGPLNALAINQRKTIAIEIFQSVSMVGAAAFGVTRGIPAFRTSAAMPGVGTLAIAQGVPAVRLSSAMPAIGTFAASEFLAVRSTAAMPAVGLLTATGRPQISRTASLAATGLFVTAATVRINATAAMAGTATFSLSGFRTVLAVAVLAGTGTLAVVALPPYAAGAATMNSAGVFSVAGQSLIIPGAANMAGAGQARFSGLPTIISTVSMSALSALSAIANTYSVASTLSADSTFSLAAGNLVVLPTVAMAGAGSASFADIPFIGRTVSMAGNSGLFAAVNLLLAASVMTGASGFAASSGIPAGLVNAVMAGSGSFAGSASPEFAASLAFVGASSLLAAGFTAEEVAAVMSAAAAFAPDGQVAVLPIAMFSGASVLEASTALNVAATIAFPGQAEFKAAAHLPAIVTAGFGGAGDFTIFGSKFTPPRYQAPLSRSTTASRSGRLISA